MTKSLLIVDDDQSFLESFRYILERNDYSVSQARTGTQAVRLLQRHHFDAALIDLHLPDAVGTEIADYINTYSSHIAIIILTGRATLDSALHLLRTGVSDYLCKPTPPEIILSTLNRCIENSRLRQELSHSEQRFRQLAELSSEGVVLIQNGFVDLVNRQLSDLFGYSEEELSGMHIDNLLPDWQASHISLHNLKQAETTPALESIGRHRSGSIFPVEIRLQQLEKKNPPVLALSIMDISQRKKNEQILLDFQDKLAKSQRMESLGLMASRVAHDLNNILSGLVSYPDLLLQKMGEDSMLREEIELIRKSGRQAGDLVSDLLTVARGAKSRKEDNHLNLLVNSYRNSIEYRQLHQEFPELRIDFELDPTIPVISSSAINITQALSNLVTNGAEACAEEVVRIRIRTTFQLLEETVHGFETIPPGTYVILSVTDNGIGIGAQSRNHIFEPFYSEKELGRSGTGLGLTIIWNTIRDHNGFINLATSKKGTRFDLYFPVAAESRSQKLSQETIKELRGNGERILVIDDEAYQRDIARATLQRLGYRVYTVESGEQAVDFVRSESFDLLVLDMVFETGMNGVETFAAIKAIEPQQKALVTSGFFDPGEQQRIASLGVHQYIHKPYSLAGLGRAICEALNSR
ncbi:MAG: response regulator [Desulfocapsaceae bacterium]|jgi:PAS domain S-box-containing protein|nr:response regulator [Desulfocapsaceae bacterium]